MSPIEFAQGIEDWEVPVVRLYYCDNCRAMVPQLHLVGDRKICCAHCFFNPLGCRCKYGEYGVAETWSDYGLGEEYFEDQESE